MDEHSRIRAVLAHIGRGGDLDDFPASRSEKRALIATAGRRQLIAWGKTHRRYELTARGRRELRRRPASASRLRISVNAIVVAGAAMALGLWFSADASRLLMGMQATAVASQPAVPAAFAALPEAVAFGPVPGQTDGPLGPDEAEQSAPAPATVAPPKGPTPAAAPQRDEPKPSAKSKRKVAKAHRKGSYASRRRRNDPAYAYTGRAPNPYGYGYARQGGYGNYGSFGGQGGWSYYR
jgi:hypothetical protein